MLLSTCPPPQQPPTITTTTTTYHNKTMDFPLGYNIHHSPTKTNHHPSLLLLTSTNPIHIQAKADNTFIRPVCMDNLSLSTTKKIHAIAILFNLSNAFTGVEGKKILDHLSSQIATVIRCKPQAITCFMNGGFPLSMISPSQQKALLQKYLLHPQIKKTLKKSIAAAASSASMPPPPPPPPVAVRNHPSLTSPIALQTHLKTQKKTFHIAACARIFKPPKPLSSLSNHKNKKNNVSHFSPTIPTQVYFLTDLYLDSRTATKIVHSIHAYLHSHLKLDPLHSPYDLCLLVSNGASGVKHSSLSKKDQKSLQENILLMTRSLIQSLLLSMSSFFPLKSTSIMFQKYPLHIQLSGAPTKTTATTIIKQITTALLTQNPSFFSVSASPTPDIERILIALTQSSPHLILSTIRIYIQQHLVFSNNRIHPLSLQKLWKQKPPIHSHSSSLQTSFLSLSIHLAQGTIHTFCYTTFSCKKTT